MAHDIEINKDGTARFAYNAKNGAPWHTLGVSVEGLQDLDTMLRKAGADYEVRLTKVAAVDDEGNFIVDSNGKPVVIEDANATIRVNADGTMDSLATVGNRYEVRQNREIAERALAVVGASNGDAVIDTCGVLRGGRRFFMTIDLGSLFIDPKGVNDKIDRYLVVSKGHDGIWPIRYANTDVRAVCNNTVMMGLQQAQRVFTARHTRNVDFTLEDAREVLRISVDWADAFKKEAEKLLAVPVTPIKIDKVLNSLFPEKKDETDRQKKNRIEVIDTIRGVHLNDRNAGGYGNNAWSLYNSVVEYLDHHREATVTDRALATMDDNSWVTRTKMDAHKAVLALV
jgi:phage/plasmid-like protein (TIGR03299 family)